MKLSCTPRWARGLNPALVNAQHELDQMFAQFMPRGRNGDSTGDWQAPISVWEENNTYFIDVDLPGVNREDVELTLEENTLRISAERKPAEGERKFWHQERGFGKTLRVISLPDVVDHEAIEAELREGVLSLKLTKRPEAQPRKIEIKPA